MRKVIRAAAVALTVASLAAGPTQVAYASGSHGSTTHKKKKKVASKKTKGKTTSGKKTKGKKTRTTASQIDASAKLIDALAKATAKSDPQLSGELKKLGKP